MENMINSCAFQLKNRKKFHKLHAIHKKASRNKVKFSDDCEIIF